MGQQSLNVAGELPGVVKFYTDYCVRVRGVLVRGENIKRVGQAEHQRRAPVFDAGVSHVPELHDHADAVLAPLI